MYGECNGRMRVRRAMKTCRKWEDTKKLAVTENVFVTTSRQFLRCLVSTYGDKCIKVTYIMAPYLLSLGRLCNAVLVRFEKMNDNLGMCVRLSISPSTDDALFRS